MNNTLPSLHPNPGWDASTAPVGKHCILELYGCSAARLNDEAFLRSTITQAVHLAGATLLHLISHRLRFWTQGGLLKSVIASLSIPGVLPPARMEDGSIHVDGSVMDNLPIDEARRCTSGFVIAISLDHGEGQRVIPTLARTENKLMRWLASMGWADRTLPLITDTIMHSILGAARQKSDDVEHLADLLLKPDVMTIGLLEWSRFTVALEAGYQAAKQNQAAFDAIRQRQPPIADN